MTDSAARKQEEPESKPAAVLPERAKEKPKEKGWSDWIAVTTAALAVITAFASAELAKNSGATLRLTNQETDQWNFYQSKSIKEHTYKLQSEMLALLPREASLDEAREKTRQRYLVETERYGGEKKEIEAKAHALAAERQGATEHAGRLTKALIALQIAIVLSSVSGLTKKKWLYVCGLVLGAIGIGLFGWGAWM